MGQKLAAYNASDVIYAYYDSVDSPAPEGVETIELTDEQWQFCLANPGCTVASGAPVAPVPPTTEQLAAIAWAAYQASAKAALDESDITILRCYENAVATPAAWATYRKSLRTIISATTGDATQPLPSKPAYPTGT